MTGQAPAPPRNGTLVEAFLREMDSQFAGRREGAEDLRRAIAADQLALYCQPIAALAAEVRYPMAEVLVRLRAEESSLLPPGEFLALFEHHGLMPELDRWVVRQALRQAGRGPRLARLAVNVSAQTVRDTGFPLALAEELLAADATGSALVFELDEAILLAGGRALARFATAVRRLGCGITIDGFGRRAVSFAPLKGGWVDFVKVEGAIVRRLLTSETAELRLKAVLRVGETMGFGVIAEMVEDAELVGKLMALGVPYAQGFGICRPQPIEEFAAR